MAEQTATYSLLDHALARFLVERSKLDGDDRQRLRALLQQLSNQLAGGDSCIPVDSESQALVERSGLASGGGTESAPLVVDDERLYLYRYWSYENRLATQLKRLNQASLTFDESLLSHYFGDDSDINWQRAAARCALTSNFTIITGGPGTGKTTTVVKIVAMLLEQADGIGNHLNIALAAPTGKAAMRLQQSIIGSREQLPCDAHIREMIPAKVVTLHRLLGPKRFSPYFQHRADNPLPHDLVIVDEASMVDLALMSKLVDALKPDAKLILLGDKNQLASVESGAVLADLIEALPDKSAELKQSFRFDENIKAVAEGVNAQHAEKLWQALVEERFNNVSLLSTGAEERVVEQSQDYWRLINNHQSFTDIMMAFGKFQCLATNRIGPLGVVDINNRVEALLADRRLIERDEIGSWYHGRPIIVTRNIPELGLFNGDIGITLNDANNNLRVYFEGDEEWRDFIPSRISYCETAWAMTVHKSQGSEFDEVLVLFPEVLNPVLTKELLYTAITRARHGVELAVTKEIWHGCVNQRIERHSGLAQKITN